LSFLGIGLNELRNADTAELIFSDASQFKFSVIRTDEELMIARSVWRIPRTALESAELNELDRFHFVMDTIDRLPQTGDKGITLKQQLKNKLIEHKQYIDKHGQDMPEIRNWKWKG
jgi:hypothetical protein